MPPIKDPTDPRTKGMNGPICPGCESVNVVVTSTRNQSSFACPNCGWTESFTHLQTALDPSEHHKLRRRLCRNCHTDFVTAEITLTRPNGTPVPWYWLNEVARTNARERQRRKNGYFGIRITRRTIVRSAILKIRATVFPPSRDWNTNVEDLAS